MKRASALAALRFSVSFARPANVVEEYIREAEHIEGYGYWRQFQDTAALLRDVDLYIANREDPKGLK